MKIKILNSIKLKYSGKYVLHKKGEILDIDKKVAEKLSLVDKYKEYPNHIEILEDKIIEDIEKTNKRMK